MEIKILGTGCQKTIALQVLTEEALRQLKLNVKIIRVQDFKQITLYGVFNSIGLVINEKLKLSGDHIPTIEEIKELINNELQYRD